MGGIKLSKDMVSAGDQLQPDSMENSKEGIVPQSWPLGAGSWPFAPHYQLLIS